MPEVIRALEDAWADSLPLDPKSRHEECGWIYWEMATNGIEIVRAKSGSRAAIDLDNPPEFKRQFVVGKVHTHPNPSAMGWETGPSESDIIIDEEHGVPDLIRADDGIHFSGPDRRRGGLTGNLGYPAEA